MTLTEIRRSAIEPALLLLPAKMCSSQAEVMLLTNTGLQPICRPTTHIKYWPPLLGQITQMSVLFGHSVLVLAITRGAPLLGHMILIFTLP